MRVSAVDENVLVSSAGVMPILLEQRANVGPAIAKALIALPLAGLTSSLLAVVAAALVSEPIPGSMLIDKPEAALALLAGLAVTAALIVHPIAAAVQRIGRRQTVEIAADRVTVTEVSPFRRRVDVEPMANYSGLAHHIRSSLSGVRHEIVLVHRDPARSVLLSASPKVLQSELDRMAADLRLPIVPASAIYAKAAARRAAAAPAVTATAADYQAIAA